jgi:hypothetical protein
MTHVPHSVCDHTYSETRDNFASVLEEAERDGAVFRLSPTPKSKYSPLDVPGVKLKASTEDLVAAVREGRKRSRRKILVVREGLEPATSPNGISKLPNYIAHLSPEIPPDPRIWHSIWHWSRDAVVAQLTGNLLSVVVYASRA